MVSYTGAHLLDLGLVQKHDARLEGRVDNQGVADVVRARLAAAVGDRVVRRAQELGHARVGHLVAERVGRLLPVLEDLVCVAWGVYLKGRRGGARWVLLLGLGNVAVVCPQCWKGAGWVQAGRQRQAVAGRQAEAGTGRLTGVDAEVRSQAELSVGQLHGRLELREGDEGVQHREACAAADRVHAGARRAGLRSQPASGRAVPRERAAQLPGGFANGRLCEPAAARSSGCVESGAAAAHPWSLPGRRLAR